MRVFQAKVSVPYGGSTVYTLRFQDGVCYLLGSQEYVLHSTQTSDEALDRWLKEGGSEWWREVPRSRPGASGGPMTWVRKAIPVNPRMTVPEVAVGWDGQAGWIENQLGEVSLIKHWTKVRYFEKWIQNNPYWVEVPTDPDLVLPEGL